MTTPHDISHHPMGEPGDYKKSSVMYTDYHWMIRWHIEIIYVRVQPVIRIERKVTSLCSKTYVSLNTVYFVVGNLNTIQGFQALFTNLISDSLYHILFINDNEN